MGALAIVELHPFADAVPRRASAPLAGAKPSAAATIPNANDGPVYEGREASMELSDRFAPGAL